MLQNKNVLNGVYRMSADGIDSHGDRWTPQQIASIKTKATVDTFSRRLEGTLGQNYDQPMRNLDSHLTGSSNTLRDQIQAAKGDFVIKATEETKEISKQELSTLMACMRMRAMAIQQAECELMTDDDLDHLEIVKQLAQNSQGLTGRGGNEIYGLAVQTQEAFQNGHNIVKFKDRALPKDLMDLVGYSVMGRMKILSKKSSIFSQEAGGGPLNETLKCIIKSLA
jgi:hypothetical protein